MRAVTKVLMLDDNGEKFYGEGPCRLMHGIEKTGSMRAAAMELGMAYSKAMRLMKHAEESLGFALTVRSAGGKAGGGSVLTEEGMAWMEKYEAYRDACVKENLRLYREFFGE